MGLRYKDLVIDLVQRMAPAPPGPCGCTASAPNCTKATPNPQDVKRPNCPKPSAAKPPKRRFDGLEELRRQLRAEIRTS